MIKLIMHIEKEMNCYQFITIERYWINSLISNIKINLSDQKGVYVEDLGAVVAHCLESAFYRLKLKYNNQPLTELFEEIDFKNLSSNDYSTLSLINGLTKLFNSTMSCVPVGYILNRAYLDVTKAYTFKMIENIDRLLQRAMKFYIADKYEFIQEFNGMSQSTYNLTKKVIIQLFGNTINRQREAFLVAKLLELVLSSISKIYSIEKIDQEQLVIVISNFLEKYKTNSILGHFFDKVTFGYGYIEDSETLLDCINKEYIVIKLIMHIEENTNCYQYSPAEKQWMFYIVRNIKSKLLDPKTVRIDDVSNILMQCLKSSLYRLKMKYNNQPLNLLIDEEYFNSSLAMNSKRQSLEEELTKLFINNNSFTLLGYTLNRAFLDESKIYTFEVMKEIDEILRNTVKLSRRRVETLNKFIKNYLANQQQVIKQKVVDGFFHRGVPKKQAIQLSQHVMHFFNVASRTSASSPKKESEVIYSDQLQM